MTDIVRYGRAQVDLRKRRPKREEQAALNAARREVRLAALKVKGAVDLGQYAMDGVVELDDHRIDRAGMDPARNVLLAELEAATVQQVKKIQRELFNPLAP